jgi:endopolyphosphatase
MKAILMGHVPPARVDSKESWDETCWQKYTLWQRQFRDVIVGGLYGHMNIDHFMLQDFDQISKDAERGRMASGSQMERLEEEGGIELYEDGEVTVASASDYLLDLREAWAQLPAPPGKSNRKLGKTMVEDEDDTSFWKWLTSMTKDPSANGKTDKSDKKKYFDMIGGKFAERYSVTHVAPSVVPNYYPTLRIVEYNISGLESSHLFASDGDWSAGSAPTDEVPFNDEEDLDDDEEYSQNVKIAMRKKKKNKKGPRKYKFRVPEGPSKSSPPGPAYSPQTFTFTRYTQYFANLTHINNDFVENNDTVSLNQDSPRTIFGLNVTEDGQIENSGWKEGKHGKHQGKQPRPEPHPKEFAYEIEYDTKKDGKFPDLTVRRWVEYARRIGSSGSKAAEVEKIEDDEERGAEDSDGGVPAYDDDNDDDDDSDSDGEDPVEELGKKHKKKKHHKASKEWYTFARRAFVSTMNPHEIKQLFRAGPAAEVLNQPQENVEL